MRKSWATAVARDGARRATPCTHRPRDRLPHRRPQCRSSTMWRWSESCRVAARHRWVCTPPVPSTTPTRRRAPCAPRCSSSRTGCRSRHTKSTRRVDWEARWACASTRRRGRAITEHRGNERRVGSDPAHALVTGIGDEQIAVRAAADRLGRVEQRVRGGAAISEVAACRRNARATVRTIPLVTSSARITWLPVSAM